MQNNIGSDNYVEMGWNDITGSGSYDCRLRRRCGKRHAGAGREGRQVILQFTDGQAVLRLNDSKAADNMYNMLPLQLSFRDFNRTEKIAYPPQPVHAGLRPEGHQPGRGDLCVYAPWGNLCIFYRDYSESADLFYLGRVEKGMELLEKQENDFTVTLSRK